MTKKLFLLILSLLLTSNTLPYSFTINNCDTFDLDWYIKQDDSYSKASISGSASSTLNPAVAPDPSTGDWDEVNFATPNDWIWRDGSPTTAPADNGTLYVRRSGWSYITALDQCPPAPSNSGGGVVTMVKQNKLKPKPEKKHSGMATLDKEISPNKLKEQL